VSARARVGGGGVVVALLLLGLLAGVASPGFPVPVPAAVGRAVAGALGGRPAPPWPTSPRTTWPGT
jgi:hypothetical protein